MQSKTLHFVMLILSCFFFPCLAFSEDFKCDKGAVPCGVIPDSVFESSTIIEVRLNAGGDYLVNGFVNGQPTLFKLDTGTYNTALAGDFALRLGVTQCKKPGVASTPNGPSSYCRLTVDTLSFAGFEFSNVSVVMMPNMSGYSLIGNNLLSKLKITMQNGVMHLSR